MNQGAGAVDAVPDSDTMITMSSPSTADSSLTPWLSGDVSPVYIGPYKRLFPAGPYSCWDGRAWFGDAATPAKAAAAVSRSAYQGASWRGLAASTELPCSLCRGHGVLDDGVDDDEGWPTLTECTEC